MPLIPIRVGDRSALVEKPEPSECSVPGFHDPFWSSCDYPVRRDGKTATCDARLCEKHAVTATWGNLQICPAHSRLAARAR